MRNPIPIEIPAMNERRSWRGASVRRAFMRDAGLSGFPSPPRKKNRVQACNSLLDSAILAFAACFATLALAGCGSARNPQLGPISVTNPSGSEKNQLSSVIVDATVAVSVSVSGDSTNLGVDWNLNCLGSAVATYTTNVCGVLNPVHVGSNINMLFTAPEYVPIGNTVTLTASVTSDPSQQSSVTLTILPQPITIAFTGTPPPAQLGASETAQLEALVTYDPIAAGVNWKVTCGSSSCGSLNPTLTASGNPTTYTAPAGIPPGGKVTITATSVSDSTKSTSATIAILPVSVTVFPPGVKVPARGSVPLTATVAYDAFDAGVDWEAPNCGTPDDCGSVSPAHTASGTPTTYTAPNTTPADAKVTVTARSTTDPKASATVQIAIGAPPPIQVSLKPASDLLQLGGSTTVVATVLNDYADAGVNWLCGTGQCYPTISKTAPYQTTYTAPTQMPPDHLFTVKASSITDPTKIGTANIQIAQTISVAITSAPATVTAGSPSNFIAKVTNDIGSGGVDWTASNCGQLDCGTFNSGNANAPNHSASGAAIAYTPPLQIPATTVTITATSTASETVTPVQSASTQTTVIPVPYAQFVPFAPSTLPLSNTASPVLFSLIAVAANDTSNEGVDWAVCSAPSTCGEFLVAPAIPPTLSNPRGVPPVYASTLHAPSGRVVSYLPPSEMPGSGTVTIKATATVNKSATTSATVSIANETTGFTGVALNGVVQTGTLPVSGASVQLYAAGSTGYGSASTPLVINSGSTIVTTGTDGSFAIPAGYTCPLPSTELYLVALGGVSGGAKANAQLGMIAALGPCSNLNSTVSLTVNEVTTIASVWALAPFTGADYEHIGSSASNYASGFANAFESVNNLVDITTGKAVSITPAGYGTAPQAEVNTLANAIDSCAATAGGAPGDGSACSDFFEASNVSPLGMGNPANSPTTILQAVLEVAQYPGNLYATPTPATPLYNIAAAMTSPPFLPVLTAAPNDWSLAISFTGGGLGGSGPTSPESNSMAIDGAGNVWFSNRRIASVSELSNLGAPLSPFATGDTTETAGGFTGGGLILPKKIAIDLQGNAWVLNADSSLTELDFQGEPVKGTPFSGGGTATANGLAIDGSGFAWVTDAGPPGDVARYAGFNAVINGKQIANGTPVSPTGGYVAGIQNPNGAIAIDGSNTVWVLNEGNYAAAELNAATGALLRTDYGYLANSTTGLPLMPLASVFNSIDFGQTMAIDNAGTSASPAFNVYIPNPSTSGFAQIYELLAGGSVANDGGIGETLSLGIPPVYAPIAIDGSGHLWLVTQLNTNNGQPASLTELSASGSSLNVSLSAPGLVGPGLVSGPSAIAVDGSGNVWVLIDAPNSTVTEFIGVAAPVVTPLALGSQTKALGQKP